MFQVEVEDSLGKLGGVGSTLCQVSGTHPQNATNEKIQIQYPNTELYSKVGALLEFWYFLTIFAPERLSFSLLAFEIHRYSFDAHFLSSGEAGGGCQGEGRYEVKTQYQ